MKKILSAERSATVFPGRLCRRGLRVPCRIFLTGLSDSDVQAFKFVRKNIHWGWKRDSGKKSRVVYFQGRLSVDGKDLYLECPYFFCKHKLPLNEARRFHKKILGALEGHAVRLAKSTFSVSGFTISASLRKRGSSGVIRYEVSCCPKDKLLPLVLRRLCSERPHKVPPLKLIKESKDHDLREYAPFDVLCGSGLSYEAGVPTLPSIHEDFYVDVRGKGFIFGEDDPLPLRFAADPEAEFRKLCRFNIVALKASPSRSHYILKQLHDKGVVLKVFTDNLDGLLERVGLPTIPTRKSRPPLQEVEIFPDYTPVSFSKKARALLVIGVSADRRGVIRQARRAGKKIIVINPVRAVSPRAKNMDYLRERDIFFRETAEEVLSKIISYF